MIFNIEFIKSYYERLPHLLRETRKSLKKPLTYSEKLLYAHLYNKAGYRSYERVVDYVDFRPDRVVIQDGTARMAFLQFLMAGKDTSEVPASVHCDHLIECWWPGYDCNRCWRS